MAVYFITAVASAPLRAVHAASPGVKVSKFLLDEGARSPGTQRSAKLEYQTLPADQTVTLLNDLGSGYVSGIFITGGSDDWEGRERSLINVYVDGESTPSISATWVNYFAFDYAPGYFEPCLQTPPCPPPSAPCPLGKRFHTRYLGAANNSRPCAIPPDPQYNLGFYSYIPIPFSSSIKIDIQNGSSTDPLAFIASVQYQVGIKAKWGRTMRLRTKEGRISGIAPNTVVELLNTSGAGRLFGVYMLIDGPGTFAPLEGNVRFYIDGSSTPTIDYPGTEDYFLNALYFASGEVATDYVGTTFRNPLVKDPSSIFCSGACDVGAYRLHVPDPILFDDSIRVTWNCGDTSQAPLSGATYLSYLLWYYIAD